jgi:hypothetical protein
MATSGRAHRRSFIAGGSRSLGCTSFRRRAPPFDLWQSPDGSLDEVVRCRASRRRRLGWIGPAAAANAAPLQFSTCVEFLQRRHIPYGRRQGGLSQTTYPPDGSHSVQMDIAAIILVALIVLVTAAVVIGAFICAAVKDGQEDRALQAPLGIRRRTRLGR